MEREVPRELACGCNPPSSRLATKGSQAKTKVGQGKREVRVILQNVNDLTSRKRELGWFLENEEREGWPVLAYCMTEPMIPEGWEGSEVREGYAPNKESDLSGNKHLSTAVLFMKHHGVVTVRELDLEHKHMGVTWVAIEMGETRRKSVAVCTLYFPTATSGVVKEYRERQLRTLQQNLTEVRAMGYAALVATDFNCPFKERGIMADSKHNAVYWKKLRSITGMTVMNWEQKTRGSLREGKARKSRNWIWY